MKVTELEIKQAAENIGLTYPHLKAFLVVESGNAGFSPDGKIIIQFEPNVFKKRSPNSPHTLWFTNLIDVQSKEWPAFSDAFKYDANAAMESTSIGLPQIMGFHWKLLGYSSVGAMWDDFKVSEFNQVQALAKFIKIDPNLFKALETKNFKMVATIYNGSDWVNLAKRQNREPYDISFQKAFDKYSLVKF